MKSGWLGFHPENARSFAPWFSVFSVPVFGPQRLLSPGQSLKFSLRFFFYLPNLLRPFCYLQIHMLIRRAVIPTCMQNVVDTCGVHLWRILLNVQGTRDFIPRHRLKGGMNPQQGNYQGWHFFPPRYAVSMYDQEREQAGSRHFAFLVVGVV